MSAVAGRARRVSTEGNRAEDKRKPYQETQSNGETRPQTQQEAAEPKVLTFCKGPAFSSGISLVTSIREIGSSRDRAIVTVKRERNRSNKTLVSELAGERLREIKTTKSSEKKGKEYKREKKEVNSLTSHCANSRLRILQPTDQHRGEANSADFIEHDNKYIASHHTNPDQPKGGKDGSKEAKKTLKEEDVSFSVH